MKVPIVTGNLSVCSFSRILTVQENASAAVTILGNLGMCVSHTVFQHRPWSHYRETNESSVDDLANSSVTESHMITPQ